jgi:hypothetical protein
MYLMAVVNCGDSFWVPFITISQNCSPTLENRQSCAGARKNDRRWQQTSILLHMTLAIDVPTPTRR